MLGIDHNVIIVLAPTPSDIISESELNTDVNSFFSDDGETFGQVILGSVLRPLCHFSPKSQTSSQVSINLLC